MVRGLVAGGAEVNQVRAPDGRLLSAADGGAGWAANYNSPRAGKPGPEARGFEFQAGYYMLPGSISFFAPPTTPWRLPWAIPPIKALPLSDLDHVRCQNRGDAFAS